MCPFCISAVAVGASELGGASIIIGKKRKNKTVNEDKSSIQIKNNAPKPKQMSTPDNYALPRKVPQLEWERAIEEIREEEKLLEKNKIR